jgi:hypothetical protein
MGFDVPDAADCGGLIALLKRAAHFIDRGHDVFRHGVQIALGGAGPPRRLAGLFP